MRALLKLVGLLLFLFTLAILWGWWLGEHRQFRLAILNGSTGPVVVTVSDCAETFNVAPGTDATFVVGNQSDSIRDRERTVTIQQGGKSEKVTGKIRYDGTAVLDVTGDSCVVHVDCARLYSKKEFQPKPGEPLITIVKNYRGGKLYMTDFYGRTWPGEALPKSVKASTTAEHASSVGRLIRVPCEILGDVVAFTKYVAMK